VEVKLTVLLEEFRRLGWKPIAIAFALGVLTVIIVVAAVR
jgi:hypothetical protein